jgi:hypothetical protein
MLNLLTKPAARRAVSSVGVAAAALSLTVLGLGGTAAARPGAPYIGYGQPNTGAGVWCVQHQLNYAFTHWSPLRSHRQISEDGHFGPETHEAIRFFQSVMMVPSDVDGIVGPETGYILLWHGDPRYGFDEKVTNAGYCYEHIPSTV